MTLLVLILCINSVFSAAYFQMEWNKTTISPENWTQINFTDFYEEPIVVATPEYTTTTNANGISTWITNVTNTSFMLRTSDENLNAQDSLSVHYLVIERGTWTLPNSSINIQAGYVETNKYGYQGNYDGCPTDGETVTFAPSFSSNPVVLSTRGSDNNPLVWGASIVSDPDGLNQVGTSDMCVGLSRSRAGTATFSNNEIIYWVAIEEGNDTFYNAEYESLWNERDTGTSGGNWINGYGDSPPFQQVWGHTWQSSPNIILASQTSIYGGDGSWPVIYDTGNTNFIRMFVDEANERSHGGSESGGGFAFNQSGKIIKLPFIEWQTSTYNIGFGVITDGNFTSSTIIESYKRNTNISVSCIAGNCSVITTNFTSSNLSIFETENVYFTCDNLSVGNFNATFSIQSNEDQSSENITVECEIYKVYADLSPSLNSPLPLSVNQIAQNRTLTIEATVDCVGDPGTTCSNVTGILRYNGSTLFGDGIDGSVTISTANVIVNNYTHLTGNELFGDNVITVSDTSEFEEGDEIMIIQMQNGTGSGTAGIYEFKTIMSILGNDITLNSPLNNSYYSGTFNAISSSSAQIVKIPHYTDVTVQVGASITAKKWDGFSGGIVMFRANGDVNINGYVNVSDKGFRGGNCATCSNSDWGTQGEGYTGIGTNSQNANGNGGGGGYGPSGLGGEPAAGGGHGTAGGLGTGDFTTDSTGGNIIGDVNLSKMFFGGGAGAGGDNDDETPFPEDVDGGGIAVIYGKLISNANIHAKGETGVYPGSFGGTSGSGAGGTIWLSSLDLTLGDVDATGGPQITGNPPDLGGAGGDGRIRLDYNTLAGNTTPTSLSNNSINLIGVEMVPISNISGDIPLFVTQPQPQDCFNMSVGDSCTLTWTLNASGNINSSYLFDVLFESDVPVITSIPTENATISITDNIVPSFNLFSPIGKVIYNESIEFLFNIEDDLTTLNCTLYINDIINETFSCNSSTNISINKTITSGLYNWTIQAEDDLNIVNSSTISFTAIKNYWMKLVKSVFSINNDMYLINLSVENIINSSKDIVLFDFVDESFNSGSINPPVNITNSTTLNPFNGIIYGWNFYLSGFENQTANYSITKNSNSYNLLNTYIAALE